MSRPAKKATWARRVIRACWAAGAFFVVGYFPTLKLGDARVAIVAAAILAVPFGSKAPTVARGMLRGALLGALAGLSIGGAMVSLYTRPLPAPLLVTCVAIPLAAAPAAVTGLEVAAATSFCAAMASPYGHRLPGQLTVTYLLTTAVLCTVTAGVFAALAGRRRRAAERQWRRIGQ